MKCVRCDKDATYKERANLTCPSCKGRFAFEPRAGDPFSDAAFASAIDRVSARDAVRFTRDNLYYELARQGAKRAGAGRIALKVAVIVIWVAIVAWVLVAAPDFQWLYLAAHLGLGAVLLMVLVRAPTESIGLSVNVFETLLGRWHAAHGAIPKLVQRVTRDHGRARRKDALATELATYSFDRAVICDRSETVDLLLANNFHFENNCAVLSVDGYPEAVFTPVRDMLRRNANVEVYALHDASVEGHALARNLATSPEWFRGVGRVTDVGVFVTHAKKMQWCAQRNEPRAHSAFADLSAADNRWLSQYRVELAAMRPEQVIKRLFRAITQPGEERTMDDGTIYFVGGGFGGSDAGTSDGGGDSFG